MLMEEGWRMESRMAGVGGEFGGSHLCIFK